ncbi:dihydrofolate reductase [Aerococcus urinae]|uniref:dihydrofolate reductase n=1 Tax=Aerococcus mictus TaxID=2976810 RepID=UPI0012486166|nr:dihydrofolate reductase [Aerococcus mictus]KAA9232849.1 dihydrofolate reductase [Aerococcus mictus]
MLIAIWAHAANGIIGKNNQLPWHISEDMKFFKQETLHKTVVMGRKTFESMGNRPLKERKNYILTRKKSLPGVNADNKDQVQIINQMDEIIELAKAEDVMVIGGAEIYRLFWPYLDELRITNIAENVEGDTSFNPDLSQFRRYAIVDQDLNSESKYHYQFEFWERKK